MVHNQHDEHTQGFENTTCTLLDTSKANKNGKHNITNYQPECIHKLTYEKFEEPYLEPERKLKPPPSIQSAELTVDCNTNPQYVKTLTYNREIIRCQVVVILSYTKLEPNYLFFIA